MWSAGSDNPMPTEEDFTAGSQRCLQVHAALPGHAHAPYIYTRRKPKGRWAKRKFYMFSGDEEDLILSSTCKKVRGRTVFKVSSNSKWIKKKSPFYVGFCAEGGVKKTFIAYATGSRPDVCVGCAQIVVETGMEHVTLPPESTPDFAFSEDPAVMIPSDAVTLTISRGPAAEHSDFEQIGVFLREESLMSIVQVAEDEYRFDMSGHLSQFLGFCIICVLTHK